jgi:hypothetical protein
MRHRPWVSDQFFASLNCTVSDTGSQLSVELPTLLASLPRQEGDGTAAGAAERAELFQIVYADHTAFEANHACCYAYKMRDNAREYTMHK